MQSKNAVGNLINRYRAVLKKCNLLNIFGSLAVASMLTITPAFAAQTLDDAATAAENEAIGAGTYFSAEEAEKTFTHIIGNGADPEVLDSFITSKRINLSGAMVGDERILSLGDITVQTDWEQGANSSYLSLGWDGTAATAGGIVKGALSVSGSNSRIHIYGDVTADSLTTGTDSNLTVNTDASFTADFITMDSGTVNVYGHVNDTTITINRGVFNVSDYGTIGENTTVSVSGINSTFQTRNNATIATLTLADGGLVKVYDGDTLTVTDVDGVTLNGTIDLKDSTQAASGTLAAKKFNLDSAVTLVNGTLKSTADMTWENAFTLNGGNYDLAGGTLTSTADIAVTSGTFTVQAGAAIDTTGQITGALTNNGSITYANAALESTITGTGSLTIAGDVKNTGSITQKSLTIDATHSLRDEGTLTITDGITNNGTFTIAKANNANDVSGSGTTVIDSAVTNTGEISTAITINNGMSLASSVNDIKGDVTNSGTLALTGGDLFDSDQKITVDILGGRTTIDKYILNAGFVENVEVLATGEFMTKLEDVTTLINNGDVYVNGDTFNLHITGDGVTGLAQDVFFGKDAAVDGTLSLGSNTLNMIEADGVAVDYSTRDVGNLVGTGNIQVDVDFVGNQNDTINLTKAGSTATVTLTSVNVRSDGEVGDTFTYLTGELGTVTTQIQAGLATETDNWRYEFAQDSTGVISFTREEASTLYDFIAGTGTTAQTRAVNEDFTATANLGTIGGRNAITINVNNDAVINGDGFDGITINDGYTLNLQGTAGAQAAIGVIQMTGFGTALTNNSGGTLNIADMTFGNNTTDISNAGTLNFNGDNKLISIAGTGTVYVQSGETSVFNNFTQNSVTIADGATLGIALGNATVNSIANAGELLLVAPPTGTITLTTSISGTGTIAIQGRELINNAMVENDVKILTGATFATSLESVGAVTNLGTLNLLSGVLDETISDSGTTVLTRETVFGANAAVAGTVDLNDQTINMQDGSFANADINSLIGTGSLKIDVDLTDGATQSDTLTIGAGSANLNLSSVNVVTSGEATALTYLTGAGVNGLNVSVGTNGSTTASDGTNLYTFTHTNNGGLSVSYEAVPVDFADFITGTGLGNIASLSPIANTSLQTALTTGGRSDLTLYLNKGYDLVGAGNDGITILDGYTFSIDGSNAPGAEVTGFATALINFGTLNVTDVAFTNNTVDIANLGTLNLRGTNSVKSIVGSGDVNVDGVTSVGTLVAGTADIRGTLFVDWALSGGSSFETASSAVINSFGVNGLSGTLSVGENAYAVLGDTDTAWASATFERAATVNPSLEWHKSSAFFMKNATTLNSGGGIYVGGTSSSVAAANSATFAGNSLFVVNGAIQGTALSADAITTEQGAKLLISDISLVDGKASVDVATATTLTVADGSWGQDASGELDLDTLLFDSSLYAATKAGIENNIFTVEVERTMAELPKVDQRLGNLALLAVDSSNTNAASKKFVEEATSDPDDDGSTFEGSAKMGVGGNAMGNSYVAAIGGSQVAGNRVSLVGTSDSTSVNAGSGALNVNDDGMFLVAAADLASKNGEGKMQNGFGLWVQPMSQHTNADGFSSGNYEYGYDTDMFGVSVGADYTVNNNFRLGLAAHVGGGNSDSTGDFNHTENDFEYYGFSLYGGYLVNNFLFSADIGYTYTDNEVDQDHIGGSLVSDFDAATITAGLKAEYRYRTANDFTIIPHVAARINHTMVDSFDSTQNGNTIFSTEESSATTFSVPLGVALSKEFTTENGMKIVPNLGLGVMFTAGDLDADQEVRIAGVNGSATMESEIFDPVTFQGGLGLDIIKDSVTFGLHYNVDASSNLVNQRIQAVFRYDF